VIRIERTSIQKCFIVSLVVDYGHVIELRIDVFGDVAVDRTISRLLQDVFIVLERLGIKCYQPGRAGVSRDLASQNYRF
jgi:hypothetical protein